MTETEWNQQRRRIDRLERRNQLLGIAGVTLAVILMVLLISMTRQPKVLRARELVLFDDNGKPRIILSADDSEASMVFLPTRNAPGVRLDVGDGKASLSFGGDGRFASLSLTEEEVSLRLVNNKGHAFLTASEERGELMVTTVGDIVRSPGDMAGSFLDSTSLSFEKGLKVIWRAP